MGSRKLRRRSVFSLAVGACVIAAGCSSSGSSGSGPSTTQAARGDRLTITSTKPVAHLDPRYSSYNLEMVTVTGGKFWAPYDHGEVSSESQLAKPPIDLSSKKLRNLARALGPAYIRVSGSWVTNTWFDPDGTAQTAPPDGFSGILTGAEWNGVGAFARSVDGEVMTSFAGGDGNRDAAGVWDPSQADALLSYSKTHDVPLVAAEFYNEPTIGLGLPTGYTAADYTRDHHIFAKAARQNLPKMRLVGPSAAADAGQSVIPVVIHASDMVAGVHNDLDVFSYHVYNTKSKRCGGTDPASSVLNPKFLDAIDPARDYYTKIRNQYMPGAPMWVTELGEANCGGDPWAANFADVIRYTDAHGQLADGDGNVVFHNTLVGSDYGLLDEDSLTPRPTYWAAVLWDRLMGPTVLTPTKNASPQVRVYSQCTPGKAAKGATYAVLNLSADKTRTVSVANGKATSYTLSAPSLTSDEVDLNGTPLKANADGSLPSLKGQSVNGSIVLPPASVTFVVDPTTVAACS